MIKKLRIFKFVLCALVLLVSSFLYFRQVRANSGYENLDAMYLQSDKFASLILYYINKERENRSLRPITVGSIATLAARKHSDFLIRLGHLSHYGDNYLNPDERYFTLGGRGAVTEIINGFEKPTDNEPIVLNSTLAKHLIQALIVSQDDSRVIFNPFATHIGIGVSTSSDHRKFISVIDVVIAGGDFTSIPSELKVGQEINIEGNVQKPLLFKAVSLAYTEEDFDELKSQRENVSSINNNLLKPYFPPQNYIAYVDNKGHIIKNVLGGVLSYGAIFAAPFTYGASAVLAPIFLATFSDSDPMPIPVKGGIDASSDGHFSGKIPINYNGRPGLYYASILANFPGSSHAVVVGRKVIRVAL